MNTPHRKYKQIYDLFVSYETNGIDPLTDKTKEGQAFWKLIASKNYETAKKVKPELFERLSRGVVPSNVEVSKKLVTLRKEHMEEFMGILEKFKKRKGGYNGRVWRN